MSAVLIARVQAAEPPSTDSGAKLAVAKVGDKVLPRRETVKVRDAGHEKSMPSSELFWPAEVLKCEGEWLHVKSPVSEAEVLAADVVTLESAVEYFTTEIRAAATPWKHKLRGLAYQWQGDLPSAQADIEAAVQLAPRDPELHCQRGVLLLAKQEIDPAIAAFTEALRVNPQFADAYRRRSEAWLASNQPNRAIDDLTAVIALDPEDLMALLERAKLLAMAGEFDRAANDFTKLLERNPGNLEILRARAELRLIGKHTAEGIADLNEILRQRPGDPRILYVRGLAFGQSGEHDKALADFTAIVERDVANADAYFARAAVYLKLERYDRALRDLTEIVRLEPQNAIAHYEQALIWATCPVDKYRDGQRALAAARTACLLTQWEQPPCLMALAAAYAEVGNFEDAVLWQKKAQDLIPKEERAAFQPRLDCYTAQKPYRDLPTKTR
jgi:tetratricopeptide (TPR) repeat protein